MILIPLPRLVLRATGRNVHKTIPRMSILELAASSQRVGLLQNLIVIPASQRGEGREHYEVAAGGRRLAALRLLAKKHRIGKGCRVLRGGGGLSRRKNDCHRHRAQAVPPWAR